MDITSYLLGKQSGGSTINNQNKDVTIIENGSTTVSADAGYTGLGTVGITTNVQPDLESKSVTITENGTTTVSPTSGKDGLSSVEITANVGGGISDYFKDSITAAQGTELIKRIPPFSISSSLTTLSSLFDYYTNLVEVGTISNTSQVTNFMRMFRNCSSLETAPEINTSGALYFSNMFQYCKKLISVPQYNTSTATSFGGMFYQCYALVSVPLFDFSSATDLSNMFVDCSSLSDESLNNIMASCITATSYTGTKTLGALGLSNTQKNKCETLSNYQNFIAAGWTK